MVPRKIYCSDLILQEAQLIDSLRHCPFGSTITLVPRPLFPWLPLGITKHGRVLTLIHSFKHLVRFYRKNTL